MDVNHDLLAPCGLHCGVCGIFYADTHNNEKLRQKLADFYGFKPESLKCNGCLSQRRIAFCDSCEIRDCVRNKKISGCHQCSEFPCTRITEYPFKVAVQYMLKSTSERKGRTDAEWVKWNEEFFKCKACGAPAFRGARRCLKCKSEIPSITK
jgi:hypothetical protein